MPMQRLRECADLTALVAQYVATAPLRERQRSLIARTWAETLDTWNRYGPHLIRLLRASNVSCSGRGWCIAEGVYNAFRRERLLPRGDAIFERFAQRLRSTFVYKHLAPANFKLTITMTHGSLWLHITRPWPQIESLDS